MHDSYNAIRVAVTVADQNGRTTDLSGFFQGLTIKVGLDSAWSGSLRLSETEDTGVVENAIFTLGNQGRLLLQFGNVDRFAEAPIYTSRVVKAEPTFHLGSTDYTLEFIAQPAQLAVEYPNRGDGVFREGVTVGHIARTIAEQNRWPIRKRKGTGDVVTVEEGLRTYRTFNYVRESGWSFLQKYVIPIASNARGEHFRMYMDEDNVFHFHSPSFLTQSQDRVLTLVQAAGSDGIITGLTFNDYNALVTVLGGGGGAGYDYQDATKGTLEAEDSLDFPPIPGHESETARKPVRNQGTGEPVTRVLLPTRSTEEGELMARARHDYLSRFYSRANLDIKGLHGIFVDDLINLVKLDRQGRQHYMSGMYQVKSVEHTIDGAWRTSIEAYRAGNLYQSSEQVRVGRTEERPRTATPQGSYRGTP